MSRDTAMLILIITMQLLTVLYVTWLPRLAQGILPIYVIAEVTMALWALALKSAETGE